MEIPCQNCWNKRKKIDNDLASKYYLNITVCVCAILLEIMRGSWEKIEGEKIEWGGSDLLTSSPWCDILDPITDIKGIED